MIEVARETSQVDQAAEALKFLSDANRLRILTIVMREETCVCDLIDRLGLPQPLISYHLAKLRKAGLVQTRRNAQWIYYSLDPAAWAELTAPLDGLFHLKGALQSLNLPPAASLGASCRCDLMPPDESRGAEPNSAA
jgi:ArsR family transcriptional regulator, arsenate/arsenite/antimonite-responsive transcriptional repressor